MTNLIRQALDAAGYTDEPATEEALRGCFLDYVVAGYWRDLDFEDVIAEIDEGTITTDQMIRALIRG